MNNNDNNIPQLSRYSKMAIQLDYVTDNYFDSFMNPGSHNSKCGFISVRRTINCGDY